jgi:hypothetical protein
VNPTYQEIRDFLATITEIRGRSVEVVFAVVAEDGLSFDAELATPVYQSEIDAASDDHRAYRATAVVREWPPGELNWVLDDEIA